MCHVTTLISDYIDHICRSYLGFYDFGAPKINQKHQNAAHTIIIGKIS